MPRDYSPPPVTASTPGAVPVYGGRNGDLIVGYQVPQYVQTNPPATQAEIDAAQAKADALSKAVGTTVDLVYPQTRGGHDGALVEDRSAAPIGFRFDNGKSQYVNVDLNGQVTGVQQRGGGLAAVLPFIEKAVEFVFPATIPFIEGANALYAASQGNIPAAIAGAMNMGVQVPGLDTSNLKSVSNYVTGANALAKGDIGTLVNSVANATSDDSMKSDLKDAASKISLAQSVAGGNPLAALKAVTGAAGTNISQADADAEDAATEAEFQKFLQANREKAAATTGGGGLDTLAEDTTESGAGEDIIEGAPNATDLGTVEVSGKNEPEAGFDAWNPPGLDSLAPVTVTGKRNLITDSNLPVDANVGYHNPDTELSPVTVTGQRNPITDSGLPVNPNVGYHNPEAELSPVTVTGQRNPITDSGLPVDPNVGYHNPATELAPQTVTGTRSLATELNPQTVSGTRDVNTELNPVTITGTRGNNTITDSSLPVNADVGSSALDQVTVSGNREGTDLEPVTVSGQREIPTPLTVDQLPGLPAVAPLSNVVIPTTTDTKAKVVAPTTTTPKTTTPTASSPDGALPTYGDFAGIAGKVLTLGQMGKLMRYEQGLKQLDVPAAQRWADMQDMVMQNADVNKALAALAQYAPDAEKDVIPSFYAHGGAVQHLADGGMPDVQAMLAAADKADVMDALKSLGNIGSGLEPSKGRLLQMGQMGAPAQQKQLQQMSVIPQLAALLQSRGMKLAEGGRADHEHPEYDGTPVFRTGGLDGLGGKYVEGKGDGTSDDITAMLANGEYVFSADVVSALGNGSNKAGAKELDHMVQAIRSRARSAPPDKLPPDAKSPLEYLKSSKGSKNG
jgi:hypothetical protein